MLKAPKIYKNKKLNNANFGNFIQSDYQIFLSIISKIKGIDDNGKYLDSKQLQRKYTLSAKEYSNYFNGDLDNSYKTLKNTVNKLMKTDIRLLMPEDNTYWRVNVCSMAEYKEKQGVINIEFTDRIMPYLTQVKEKFVLYNLKEISHFKSIYTIRLYELIQEYKETGWMFKSIHQLRDNLAVSNTFPRYNDFKRFTFKRACDEINKLYGLNLKFEEIKEGRKVVSVKFTFNKAKVVKFIDPFTEKTILKFDKPRLLIDPEEEKLKRKKKKFTKSNIKQTSILAGQMSFNDIDGKKHTKRDSVKSIASITSSILNKLLFWNKK